MRQDLGFRPRTAIVFVNKTANFSQLLLYIDNFDNSFRFRFRFRLPFFPLVSPVRRCRVVRPPSNPLANTDVRAICTTCTTKRAIVNTYIVFPADALWTPFRKVFRFSGTLQQHPRSVNTAEAASAGGGENSTRAEQECIVTGDDLRKALLLYAFLVSWCDSQEGVPATSETSHETREEQQTNTHHTCDARHFSPTI